MDSKTKKDPFNERAEVSERQHARQINKDFTPIFAPGIAPSRQHVGWAVMPKIIVIE